MDLGSYQPTLGNILEEPDEVFDESILLEYEIVTEDDLKKALFMDITDGNEGCTCGENESDWCTFAAFHEKAGAKNKQILETYAKGTSLNKTLISESSSQYSISGSYNDGGSEGSVTDARMQHLDISSSLSGDINQSLNGSINESLLNVDEMVNASLNQPLENLGIDFNAVTGRKIFIKAIRQKYMNIYYVVSQQRLTGDFMGNQSLTAFIMVLNALDIQQTFLKGSYFQMHSVDDEISFHNIACVARDNKLSAEVSQVFQDSCIENFRKAVKLSCKSSNILLLCCYHLQNSPGHFSFVGGYYKDKDILLLLTPSRSKFIARWLPVQLMWKMLCNNVADNNGDKVKGLRGGYMLLQKNETNPRIAVRINKNTLLRLESPAVSSSQHLVNLLSNWMVWLSLPSSDVTDDVILQAINYVVNNLNTQKTAIQVGTANTRKIVHCKTGSLTDIISQTKVYNAVKNQIDSLSPDNLKRLEVFSEWILSMTYTPIAKSNERKIKMTNIKKIRKKGGKNASNKIIYKDNLMLAMCFLFWPYSSDQLNTNSSSLAHLISEDMKPFTDDTIEKMQGRIRFISNILEYIISDQ